MQTENNIADNIERIRLEIADCAQHFNRNPKDITLIGVSKYFPVEAAKSAFLAGLHDLGENRVSELIEKRETMDSWNLRPNWHLIGTLQRKKVRQIVGRTELIHSVDSLELLDEISKRSIDEGIQSPVLIQVNTSREATKHGFDADQIRILAAAIKNYEGIKFKGLMTMAPFTKDEEILTSVFSQTQQLFNDIRNIVDDPEFKILSMGMSNDYRIAIRYGATHLRIGTAIFGERTIL